MQTQFELLLPNRHKALLVLLALGGLYLGVFMAWFASLMHRFGASRGVQDFLFYLFLLLLVGLFGVPWVLRKLAYEPCTVTVAEDQLRVRNQKTGEEQQFRFADIARYRVLTSRAGATLLFQDQNGSKRGFGSDDFSLLKVAPALSQAIRRCEQQHGLPPKYRAETFFGQPVSTWFLGVFSLALLAISWHIGFALPPEPGFFVLFFSYFLLLLFCAAWYGNREQRRNY